VTTRLMSWAFGSTIAPQDPEDIERVARMAHDEWLARNWRRIASIATELRGLHISIGHRISGAMHEVVDGTGPNLQELASVLGSDAAEILDEFDLAIIRTVDPPTEVDLARIGTVERVA